MSTSIGGIHIEIDAQIGPKFSSSVQQALTALTQLKTRATVLSTAMRHLGTDSRQAFKSMQSAIVSASNASVPKIDKITASMRAELKVANQLTAALDRQAKAGQAAAAAAGRASGKGGAGGAAASARDLLNAARVMGTSARSMKASAQATTQSAHAVKLASSSMTRAATAMTRAASASVAASRAAAAAYTAMNRASTQNQLASIARSMAASSRAMARAAAALARRGGGGGGGGGGGRGGGGGGGLNPSLAGALYGGAYSLLAGGSGLSSLGAMAGGAIGGAVGGRVGSVVGAGVGQGLGMAAQAVADFGRASVEAASKFEQLQLRLRGTEGLNAGSTFKQLVQTARELNAPISEVSEQFVRLSAYGLRPAMADMKALVSYSRMLGDEKNVEFLGLALSQIASKGKVEMQELRQLAERGFPALEVLVTKMKIPISKVGDIGKMMIPSDEVLRTFFKTMEERSRMAAVAYGETLEGKLQSLRMTWEMLLGGVNPTGGVDNPLLESYKGLLDSLKSLLESEGFRNLLEDTISSLATLVDMINGNLSASPGQRIKSIMLAAIPGAGPLLSAKSFADRGENQRKSAAELRRLGIDPRTGAPVSARTGGAGSAPNYGMAVSPTSLLLDIASSTSQTIGQRGGTKNAMDFNAELQRLESRRAQAKDPAREKAFRERMAQDVAAMRITPEDAASQLKVMEEALANIDDVARKAAGALRENFLKPIREATNVFLAAGTGMEKVVSLQMEINELTTQRELVTDETAKNELDFAILQRRKAQFAEDRMGKYTLSAANTTLAGGEYGGRLAAYEGGRLERKQKRTQLGELYSANLGKRSVMDMLDQLQEANNIQDVIAEGEMKKSFTDETRGLLSRFAIPEDEPLYELSQKRDQLTGLLGSDMAEGFRQPIEELIAAIDKNVAAINEDIAQKKLGGTVGWAQQMSGLLGGQGSAALNAIQSAQQALSWMKDKNSGVTAEMAQAFLDASTSAMQSYRPTSALEYGSAAEYSARMSSQAERTNELLQRSLDQLTKIYQDMLTAQDLSLNGAIVQ